jgi:diacylglycerol O-acyltransferase
MAIRVRGPVGQEHRGPAIAVPTFADDNARLAEIISLTRTSRKLARASSAGPLGLAFRALSRLGLFQTFIEHQRLVHTFETNMRGPAEPLSSADTEYQPWCPPR